MIDSKLSVSIQSKAKITTERQDGDVERLPFDNHFSTNQNPHTKNQASSHQKTFVNEAEIAEQIPKNIVQDQDKKIGNVPKIPIPVRTLTETVANDGQDDTTIFLNALDAYLVQDWRKAIEDFTRLINIYAGGRYSERSYFLLAKAFYQLHLPSISVHFNEIINHFDDAMSRFPTSEYVSDALLDIGNLYFKNENYFEAQGHYNLVVKKEKNSILAVRALIQKARILLIKKKNEDALSVLTDAGDMVSGFPEVPEKTEVKIAKSKAFYAMNRFHESVHILTQLSDANPESVYQYPEGSLYLGYNYYQLGENEKARDNLFRFYNTFPDKEISNLILTQIGDTYRNGGRIKDAVNLYQLVLERHPDTEGAVISQIRLAEQQEDGSLEIEKGIVPSFKIIGKKIISAIDIYGNIAKSPLSTSNNSSLKQLVMLKLAILHQKERAFKESLEALKMMAEKYPKTSLRKELEHAMQDAIKGILEEEMKNENYINIINFYLSEKELFLMLNAPELLLTVSKAFTQLNFEDMATEMLKKADTLLADKEKPPDLLFLVGRDFLEQEKLESALTRFDLLINNYPSYTFAPYTRQMKGRILLKQTKYLQAAKTFSSALEYPLTPCKRTRILTDKAKALTEGNLKEKALETVNEANDLKRGCKSSADPIYQEIGDIYHHLGEYQKAIDIFNEAIAIAKENEDKIPLKLKIAQVLWQADKKDESLAIYNQILNLNDPFWSSIVREKMQDIEFNNEIREMNKKLKRGENI
jgi:tetratricopeptide (TPR) repeat protein